MLLGIDLGTTWCKAAAVSEEGRELAHERVPVPWRRVATGAEIEAEQLVRIAVDVGRRVLARVPDARVAGVGVTGMAEAGVLLDSSANPTAPVIAWHDSRGREETAALERELGAECFSATTGLPPSPQWTLLKYRWMRAHLPETRCGMRWLNVPEWIVRRLGGEERGELSLASRTGLLDLDRRESWAEAREWAGAPPDLLAPPEPAGAPAGRVGAALDEARGAVLCVGGHDHLCAAVGAGAAGEGDVFDSCGTAEVFVRTVDPPLPAGTRLRATAQNVTNGWHAVPNRQALLGALDGGLALQRAGRLLGAEDAGGSTTPHSTPPPAGMGRHSSTAGRAPPRPASWPRSSGVRHSRPWRPVAPRCWRASSASPALRDASWSVAEARGPRSRA